jgi:uncharacterized protein (TIGR02679 family)
MGPDTERVRRVLGAPELSWLVDRLRRRVELGRPLTGTVTLPAASEPQRRAVARLLGRAAGDGASLSVSLERLDASLQAAGVAPDLRSALDVLTGPVRDLASERARDRGRCEALLAALAAGPAAGSDWYRDWLAALTANGTLTRLLRRDEVHLAGQAAAVLGRLPADGVPLAVLAEQVTGDTKALSGGTLATLVLRALALRASAPAPGSAAERRALWESAGVLVLNVTAAQDHVVAGWLGAAAARGIPFRLTLHQLTVAPVTPAAPRLYVCENPAVLRVAAAELAANAAPLLCTEGQPSAACRHLLAAAAGAGARIHWHGDFDWTGLRTTAAAVDRYGAHPWRMDAGSYTAALATGESEPLKGAPAASPWDPALADRLRRAGRAVMEERLIPHLLTDLSPT